MRVLHCCLAAFYIDNYGYQENLLPKHHLLMGHEVRIVASTETFISNKNLGYIEPGSYINENGIHVTRLPYSHLFPHFIAKKLRLYVGLKKVLDDFSPEILFIHDVQFLSITEIISYLKSKPETKVFIDGHTDFINSATNWISKNILHKIVYRWCAKRIEPYTARFWGVTPLRVDFYVDVYKINRNNVDLLVMGLDDSSIDFSEAERIRSLVRMNLGITDHDLVVITGGKIDAKKNIHLLMNAVSELQCENLTLIIFGEINDDIKREFDDLSRSAKIKFLGWLSPLQAAHHFIASDLAIFPGTHSVLWEQAVGCGIPCIFRRWPGMEHVNLGGNCLFLDNVNVSVIKDSIESILSDPGLLHNLKNAAVAKRRSEFLYSNIAKKAIGLQ